jgi:glycosyltransferase involved in cell wall biosynthesis
LKIVFIDTYPVRRGAQIFVTELADFLQNQGQKTFRIYLYKSGNQTLDVGLRNQDICLGFDPKHIFEKIPTLQPLLVLKLIKVLNYLNPDIVLLNGSRTLKYGAVVKRALPKTIRWVSRVIDNAEFWNTDSLTHWYYKNLVIPAMDGSIGVSQSSLDAMIRHYDFKKPSSVVHRVFDSKKFEQAPDRKEARGRLGLTENDEVLLFLGNLTSQKRPDRFIQIIQELAKTRPNVRGLLVGDGGMRKELEYQVSGIKYQEKGNEGVGIRTKRQEARGEKQETSSESHESIDGSFISFEGYQSDVSPFLAAADLLVLTSDTEGLPGVILEAAYFSVPAVASDVGGIRECLVDGETGVLIPTREVSGFCSAIGNLLDDPDRRKKIGEAAKALVEKDFRMEVAGQQYLDFFKSLVG